MNCPNVALTWHASTDALIFIRLIDDEFPCWWCPRCEGKWSETPDGMIAALAA